MNFTARQVERRYDLDDTLTFKPNAAYVHPNSWMLSYEWVERVLRYAEPNPPTSLFPMRSQNMLILSTPGPLLLSALRALRHVRKLLLLNNTTCLFP